jgi:repressor LexA
VIPLTDRQREVLVVIEKYISEHGYSPTMQELADTLGVYLKCAYDHIRALERKGWITKIDKKPRTIVILK